MSFRKGKLTIIPLLDITVFLTRLLVGGILTIAGLLKLKRGSHRFLQSVLSYGLVKGRVAQLLASSLPWLEVGCGLFLLIGLFLPVTVLLGFGLLMMFTLAVTSVIVREKQVDCGCFGATRRKNHIRWQLTYRNLVLMGLTIIIFNFGPGWFAVDSWLQEGPRSLVTDGTFQNSLMTIWLVMLLVSLSLHLMTRPYNRFTKHATQHGQGVPKGESR